MSKRAPVRRTSRSCLHYLNGETAITDRRHKLPARNSRWQFWVMTGAAAKACPPTSTTNEQSQRTTSEQGQHADRPCQARHGHSILKRKAAAIKTIKHWMGHLLPLRNVDRRRMETSTTWIVLRYNPAQEGRARTLGLLSAARQYNLIEGTIGFASKQTR